MYLSTYCEMMILQQYNATESFYNPLLLEFRHVILYTWRYMLSSRQEAVVIKLMFSSYSSIPLYLLTVLHLLSK